jgi:hypothetical protein
MNALGSILSAIKTNNLKGNPRAENLYNQKQQK